MARGAFIIQELQFQAGAGFLPSPDGEQFIWSADRVPPDPDKGGARAVPRQTWTIGGRLRTVRTDYPGSKTPSEQVLGAHQKDQTFEGRFQDKYNFPGYADQEMKRFERMARRGNLLRIQFQNQAFLVLIKDWDFPYRFKEEIHYRFTVSVHDRPEDHDIGD